MKEWKVLSPKNRPITRGKTSNVCIGKFLRYANSRIETAGVVKMRNSKPWRWWREQGFRCKPADL